MGWRTASSEARPIKTGQTNVCSTRSCMRRSSSDSCLQCTFCSASSIPQEGEALREQQTKTERRDVVDFAGGMLKKGLGRCTYGRIEAKEYICWIHARY